MKSDLVLGIDCSTTGAKAVVWNMAGEAVSLGRVDISHTSLKPGWGEQDPLDWWTATRNAIGKACRQIDISRLAAMAITHQRETFAYLDKDGNAVRPAMLWLDMRATKEVEKFGDDYIHKLTGKPANTATSWYKMLWLRDNEPRSLESTRRVVDVHGYLVHRLTGEWVTSYGSVDPLGVLNLETFQLDSTMIDKAGLSKEYFGEIYAPGTLLGTVKKEIAEDLGLPIGLKVIAGLGDGQSAGLGAGIIRSGEAYLNLGTGIVSGVFSKEFTTDRSFRTMTGGILGTYLLESFFGGGTYNINWFVDQFSDIQQKPFGLNLSPEQILEVAAAALPVGSERLIALPYLTGVLTPYWDSKARGVLFGLSGRHGKAHIYRAILEGLAMEQRLSTTAAEAAIASQIQCFRMMGGGTHSALWCQIIADVLARPVEIAREAEATCLGAAILAATGSSLFGSVSDAVQAMCASGKTYEPDPKSMHRYDALYDVYKDIYPALKNQFDRLQDIDDENR